mgnify:CR=1 FL=1|jgi:hypothetical protein
MTKEYLKKGFSLLIVIVAMAIFSDWKNFKAGLFGKTPISIHKNN